MGACQNYQLALAGTFQDGSVLGLEWGQTFPAWFQAIPPERVGLNGEYDHYGLQKRVEALYRKHFSFTDLPGLKISQRGRVVVLQGAVDNQALLQRLIDLAMEVDGCIRVETLLVTCEAEFNTLKASR